MTNSSQSKTMDRIDSTTYPRAERKASGTTLIGLDGVGWPLIEDLRANADVPTIDQLVDRSVHGITKSTIPSLTCPALPSLYTGRNPGNLGIFDFVKPDGDIVDYDDVSEPGIWDYLSTADTDIVVGAMRTTHPAPDINGVFISDVLSTEGEPNFVTPDWAREFGERFHAEREHVEQLKKEDDDDALLNAFIKMNEKRTDVLLELIDRVDPQFALLWFGLSDGAQHYFWDDRPRLYKFFESMDDCLAAVLEARSETNTVVVGDHGFGPPVSQEFHINEALSQAGYLTFSGGRVRRLLTRLSYRLSENLLTDQMKRFLLEALNIIGSSSDDERETDEMSVVVTPFDSIPGVDWSRTQAHASTRKGWGVNIVEENISGSYEMFRSELIDYLCEIETPNGEPAIVDAWPGEELYWGAYESDVPDVVVLTNDHIRIRPSLIGRLYSRADPTNQPSHESSRDAIFMATGPDIVEDGDNVGSVDLYDIAPTLFDLHGVPVPERMDGTPVSGILRTGRQSVTQATYSLEPFRIKGILDAIAEEMPRL